jgi:hypothetical protein
VKKYVNYLLVVSSEEDWLEKWEFLEEWEI